MNIQVTVQTSREFFQQFFAVRMGRCMAIGTLWNLFVTIVTLGAIELSMLTQCPLPFHKNIIVAAVAGSQVGVLAQADCKWLMNIVTRCTTGKSLGRKVWLVALIAGRNIPVLSVMTVAATHLRMLAGAGRQLLCLLVMAI